MLPKLKPKREGLTPSPHTTKLGEFPRKVTTAEPEPRETDCGLLSNMESQTQYDKSSSFSNVTSECDSSDEDETHTDSLTSYTMPSESTRTKSSFSSPESLTDNLTQDTNTSKPASDSITESQFSSSMPYLEGTDQPEMTSDSLFIPEDESQREQLEEPPALQELRRSTRSTRGQP